MNLIIMGIILGGIIMVVGIVLLSLMVLIVLLGLMGVFMVIGVMVVFSLVFMNGMLFYCLKLGDCKFMIVVSIEFLL